jgi:hypothetical protein
MVPGAVTAGAQVRRGGELVHFEAFVQELQEHTVLYGNSIGSPPPPLPPLVLSGHAASLTPY